jgi:hypothetical protein
VNDTKEVLTAGPVFTPLDPEAALRTCDGHASGGVQAVVSVLLPTGGILELCGHHARVLGYEHTAFAKPENRQKGSDH